MSTNEFPTAQQTSAGAGAFAFERAQDARRPAGARRLLRRGPRQPAGGQYIGQLPGDLDGATPPPAGAPNLFAEVDDAAHPADGARRPASSCGSGSSTSTGRTRPTRPSGTRAPSSTLPVAPFVRPQCVYGYGELHPAEGRAAGARRARRPADVPARVPQLRRPRVACCSTTPSRPTPARASAGTRSGSRRAARRRSTSRAPTPRRRGDNPSGAGWAASPRTTRATSPLGFSASGPNDYPSVRYTGRNAGDPLGQMTQAEQVAYTGTGPQTEAEGRWGDYSDLTVDPSTTAPSGTRRSTSAPTQS